MTVMHKYLMSGAWHSLVARVLWELPIIQTKAIAINRLSKNITTFLVRFSEDFLVTRVLKLL